MNDAMKNNESDLIFLKDSDWKVVDGDVCRVVDFIPNGTVCDGRVEIFSKSIPYASVLLRSIKFPGKGIKGFITHKLDFVHLWKAFKERGVKHDEEVLVAWGGGRYRNRFYKLLSFMLPKLWVMVCPKNAFEVITDKSYRPELTGEARAIAGSPIIDWKPEVMK